MENLDFTRPSSDTDVITINAGDEGDVVVAAHPNERNVPTTHEGTVVSMIRYVPSISLGWFV